jgi:hypothetical protein
MEETKATESVEIKNPTVEDVLKQWEQLAEPSCKKCDGTGVQGWLVKDGTRSPIPCYGKRCVVQKYQYFKLVQKRAELAKKQEQEGANDAEANSKES